MKQASFWVAVGILSIYLSLFALQKINLTTADIGRHIVNGDMLLHPEKYSVTRFEVLHTNLFSYTEPDFPFINHHWLSGIFIYIIYTLFGFTGLSLSYLLCIISGFILLLSTTRIVIKEVSTTDILLGSLFLIPLIADRTEVRPEGISYVFIAFFIFLLSKYSQEQEDDSKKLWILPILEILWVNMHIYFIFGPCIIGAFLVQELIKKNWQKSKQLAWVLLATTFATLLNPFGLTLAFYPLHIFQNYGYLIVENQSIYFLENLSFFSPSFLWYKITVAMLFMCTLSNTRNLKTFPFALTFISFTFAIFAYFGIRSMTAFAFVSLPLVIYCISVSRLKLENKMKDKEAITILSGILCFIIIFCTSFHFQNKLPWNANFGTGLLPGVENSADFVKQNGIHGPIFNNYDLGSYLIFNTFPKEKVFVDNRPEAYSVDFFQKTYVPMQENDTVWKKELEKYKFNMIYFYRLDMTPWAQKFLIARVTDRDWAPVYVDAYTIIFLKHNAENNNVIIKYELPKSMFNVQ